MCSALKTRLPGVLTFDIVGKFADPQMFASISRDDWSIPKLPSSGVGSCLDIQQAAELTFGKLPIIRSEEGLDVVDLDCLDLAGTEVIQLGSPSRLAFNSRTDNYERRIDQVEQSCGNGLEVNDLPCRDKTAYCSAIRQDNIIQGNYLSECVNKEIGNNSSKSSQDNVPVLFESSRIESQDHSTPTSVTQTESNDDDIDFHSIFLGAFSAIGMNPPDYDVFKYRTTFPSPGEHPPLIDQLSRPTQFFHVIELALSSLSGDRSPSKDQRGIHTSPSFFKYHEFIDRS